MQRLFLTVPALLLIFGCVTNISVVDAKREGAAIEFLRGVYAGDSSVVDRLAAPGIVVSYPIFRGSNRLRD
jgi:hypothetical protein